MKRTVRSLVLAIFSLFLIRPAFCGATEKNVKTVLSSDMSFQLKMPSDWIDHVELNPSATLQAKSPNDDFFLIIIPDAKTDLDRIELKTHTDITLKNMLTALENTSFSDLKPGTVAGKKSYQRTIEGTLRNIRFVYMQTTVEDENAFYQILGWSLKSKHKDYLKSYNETVQSFEFLSGSNPSAQVAVKKLIIPPNRSCQIYVPLNWRPYPDLNKDAAVQVGSPTGDLFLMVIPEKKEDFQDYTLKDYFRVTTDSLKKNLKDAQNTKPEQKKINGLPAYQAAVSGVLENGRFTYLFTTVEGKTDYYQVIAFSLKSKYDRDKDLFQQIVNTFQPEESVRKNTSHVLWEVKGPNKNKVFLLGSLHVLSETDYPLDPVLENAYQKADTVFFEVSMDDAEMSSLRELTVKLGTCEKGKTLTDYVSKDTFKKFEAEVKRLNLAVEYFINLKPWMAGLSLLHLKFQKIGLDAEHGIDKYFFARAREDRKSTAALEKQEFQLNIFSSMSAQDQEDMLLESIQSAEKIEGEFAQLLEAWKFGDVAKLNKLFHLTDKETPHLKEVVYSSRNKSWLGKIHDQIKTNRNLLFVVGSAHLIGDESVVQLLTKKGYTLVQR
ncbi:MAG: TraB/GumN family protein [Elusimicrobia bacterium]|nr:TraB/GumN family protein [Candidatus Obscuribacterium magneticum]